MALQGISLILDLIDVYGLEVVQAYMHHIQSNAEVAVRQMLKEFGLKFGKSVLHSEDYMDDGTKIELTVEIDTVLGNATFDFRYVICVAVDDTFHTSILTI